MTPRRQKQSLCNMATSDVKYQCPQSLAQAQHYLKRQQKDSSGEYQDINTRHVASVHEYLQLGMLQISTCFECVTFCEQRRALGCEGAWKCTPIFLTAGEDQQSFQRLCCSSLQSPHLGSVFIVYCSETTYYYDQNLSRWWTSGSASGCHHKVAFS